MVALEIKTTRPNAKEYRKRHGISQNVSQISHSATSRADVQSNGCCQCVSILPTDFQYPSDPLFPNAPLSVTYVITSPGKYVLNQDIIFLPLAPSTPAIEILSNDVTLDLCHHTLSQGNAESDSYGVQIGEGYNYSNPDNVFQNITIQNGTIRNFSAIGIFCYNGSFDGPTAQIPFQDLHFFDLNILECGADPSFDFASGIDLDSAASLSSTIITPEDPVAYSGVLIERCNINRCIGHGAINIYTFDNLEIKHTTANDTSISQQIFGLCFAYDLVGRNLIMENCQGNGTRDFQPTFVQAQVGGIDLNFSLNILITDSQFNDAFGEADYIVNNNLSLNKNAIYERNQFNNNRGGESAVVIAGVHCSESVGETDNINGVIYRNCQFNGTSVSDTTAAFGGANELAGFTSIANRNVLFENCQACNIRTNNTNFKSAGFLIGTEPYGDVTTNGDLGRAKNITFRNCVATDIRGGTDAYGIVIPASNIYLVATFQGTQANIVIENCIVERVQSFASDNTRRVAGITESLFPFRGNPISPSTKGTFYDKMRNLFITGCKVADVRSNVDNGLIIPLSAGILVESVRNATILNNTVIDSDRGVLLTGTTQITPNGFQLASSLQNATNFPPIWINLTTVPAASPSQTFTNLTRNNSVSISPSATTINVTQNLILPIDDITTLGWQPGDEIIYNSNGGTDIGGLVSGTVYYLIVYIPGFSERGLIKENNVTNNLVSGYQDDKTPCTSSVWLSNTAYCNGVDGKANYIINWGGKPPVAKGSLSCYPQPKTYIENVSISCGQCDCRNRRR
jgi:hypothetical protein